VLQLRDLVAFTPIAAYGGLGLGALALVVALVALLVALLRARKAP
jgi:hypothetical protein